MEARVTQVIPAHHEHSRRNDHDAVAILVTVTPNMPPVASALATDPGQLVQNQVITVVYIDPANPARGFRLA